MYLLYEKKRLSVILSISDKTVLHKIQPISVYNWVYVCEGIMGKKSRDFVLKIGIE